MMHSHDLQPRILQISALRRRLPNILTASRGRAISHWVAIHTRFERVQLVYFKALHDVVLHRG